MWQRDLLFHELQSLQSDSEELAFEAGTKPTVGRIAWAKTVLAKSMGVSFSDDNRIDDGFKNAVRQFQATQGLPQTAEVDARTERSLLEQNALLTGSSTRTASQKISSEAARKIEDWTDKAVIPAKKKNLILNLFRDPREITALVLHHMAYKAKDSKGTYSNPKTYLAVGAHFCILRDGRIMQHHPISRFIWHSNCTSPKSVGVEFEGNFPDIKGKWWYPTDEKTGRKIRENEDLPTPAQFEAGRFLLTYLKFVLGIKNVLAHRQSSEDRENDPGPDIWFNVGEWGLKNLGLGSGGSGFKCGTGSPILPQWQNWAGSKAAPVSGTISATSPKQPVSGGTPATAPKQNDAVAKNRWYAVRLGWNQYVDQINDLLLPYSGLSNVSLGEEAFADALQNWQKQKGLQADGVLGPDTWTMFKKLLPIGGQTPTHSNASAMPERFRILVPILEKYRGKWPLGFLLAWIKKESDGSIKSYTSLDERGYFQLHPDESKTLKVDHKRLSSDPDYSIMAGIQLVDLRGTSASKYARILGVPANGEVYLALTKLMHWLPYGVQCIVEVMKRKNFVPANWESFKSFCLANRDEIQAGINRKGQWALEKGIKNADDVLKSAASFNQFL